MSHDMKSKLRKTYVKELRNLLENKVEQAEVIISAKAFGKELQEMIEKIGRLTNEDLGPVVDQMRLTYGPEMADSFMTSIRGEFEGVLETLRGAKEKIDNSVMSISQGQSLTTDTDMDSAELNGDVGGDMDMGGDLGGDIGAEELPGEELPGEELPGEEMPGEEMPEPDQFGGESEAPLGREPLATESRRAELEKRIVEMRSMLKKARSLKEQKMLKSK